MHLSVCTNTAEMQTHEWSIFMVPGGNNCESDIVMKAVAA